MRVFHIAAGKVVETDSLPDSPASAPTTPGFIWIACTRPEFEARQADIQAVLQGLTSTQLVDLHVLDLLNHQLPSHYDYTSQYDVLVFRRLAARSADAEPLGLNGEQSQTGLKSKRHSGPHRHAEEWKAPKRTLRRGLLVER